MDTNTKLPGTKSPGVCSHSHVMIRSSLFMGKPGFIKFLVSIKAGSKLMPFLKLLQTCVYEDTQHWTVDAGIV